MATAMGLWGSLCNLGPQDGDSSLAGVVVKYIFVGLFKKCLLQSEWDGLLLQVLALGSLEGKTALGFGKTYN